MALTIDSAPTAASASSLAPGFRFHPTDEELVRYYLRRRVCGKSFRFDAISDVDVYKVEPWDLPDLSRLKSRDLEWYFFSVLDKKYGNGSRTNRATEKGYWKTTGKDRTVCHRSQQIGMKKTLVYHSGRAPKGERTNWVMHEYRLIDQELEKAGILQDAFVLCRIFHKSGSGPKNGEKYGAPFIEEEWEDDELLFVPKQEGCIDELPTDMDSYLDANDIAQILYTDMPVEDGPLPKSFHEGENVSSADVSTEVTTGPQVPSVGPTAYEPPSALKSDGSNNLFDPESMNHGYIGEPSNTVNYDTDYLVLDEPYHDANNEFPLFDENFFFQEDDLKNTFDMDSGLDILNEYTSLLNSDGDDFGYAFDSIGNKNILPESSLTLEDLNDGTNQLYQANNPSEGQKYEFAVSSKQGNSDQKTEMPHPFLKKASHMLGNIPAPPAFASEFPSKYLAASSQGGAVSSGIIHISNVSFNGGVVDLSLGKHTQLNIVLSFGLGQKNVDSVNPPQAVGKVNSGASRGWFYCAFFWIMVISISFKIGSLVCPRSFIA